ncbi:Uncharacterised protein [uncultured archaeon]|nr:Uncharacterised protein [uncultured archaeon]
MIEEIEVMVPCCDQVVKISATQIVRGIMHMKLGETRGAVLVGCPFCSTALVMNPDMPTDFPSFQKWVIENADNPDWNACVPFLDERILAEPAGTVVIGGKTMYRAGAGGPLLDRYQYMVQFGIDPEMAESKKPHQPPKVLG